MYFLIAIKLAITSTIKTDFLFNWEADGFQHQSITKQWIDQVISDACINQIQNNDYLPLAVQFGIRTDSDDKMDNALPNVNTINELEHEIFSYIEAENDNNTISYKCDFQKVVEDQYIGSDRRLSDDNIHEVSQSMNKFEEYSHPFLSAPENLNEKDDGVSLLPSDLRQSVDKINLRRKDEGEIPIQYDTSVLWPESQKAINQFALEFSKHQSDTIPIGQISRKAVYNQISSSDIRFTPVKSLRRRIMEKVRNAYLGVPSAFISYSDIAKIWKKLFSFVMKYIWVVFGIVVFGSLLFSCVVWNSIFYVFYRETVVDFDNVKNVSLDEGENTRLKVDIDDKEENEENSHESDSICISEIMNPEGSNKTKTKHVIIEIKEITPKAVKDRLRNLSKDSTSQLLTKSGSYIDNYFIPIST